MGYVQSQFFLFHRLSQISESAQAMAAFYWPTSAQIPEEGEEALQEKGILSERR